MVRPSKGALQCVKAFRSFLCLCALSTALSVAAAEHRIDHISILDRDTVLIHFDTQPNREYVLQSVNRLSCVPNTAGCNSHGIPTNWVTVFTAPAYPDMQHYVIPDERNAVRRFYRLRVRTP